MNRCSPKRKWWEGNYQRKNIRKIYITGYKFTREYVAQWIFKYYTVHHYEISEHQG